jgi:Homeodomain-like domain
MRVHANAKLGLSGRLALVRAVEEGLSLRAAAAAFSVSPATAYRWWHRWCEGDRSGVSRRSIQSSATAAAAADGCRGGADPSCAAGDGAGAGQVGRPGRASSLDDLEGALASWRFAAAAVAVSADSPLRMG